MDQARAIKIIEKFCLSEGVRETSLGQMAVRNRHAVQRIRNGTASLNTTQALLDWIEARKNEDDKARA